MSTQWSLSTRIVVVVLLLVLFGLFVYAIRPLIAPLIIAALIAYVLYPVVLSLQKRTRFRHKTAVALVYFPFLALMVAAPGTLAPLFVRQLQTLSGELQLIMSQVELLLSKPVIIFGRTISQEQLRILFQQSTAALIPAAEDAFQVIETTSTSIIWILVILVTVYYLLQDWNGLRQWLLNLAPETEQRDLNRLLQEIDAIWWAYLRGTITLMFIMGVVFSIIGLAIGLPGAIGLGLVTGLLSMIPELGPSIAGIISVLVALFEGSNFLPMSNFWFAVLVAAIYLVAMQVKSLWLRPIVMGRFMHMNTGLVFVSIIGAAILSGILAALIILPLLASVGQIGKYLRSRLLGLNPWV